MRRNWYALECKHDIRKRKRERNKRIRRASKLFSDGGHYRKVGRHVWNTVS